LKKIIFFDIDGTLLEYRKGMDRISDKTLEAMQELRRKGVKLVLCSGRALSVMDDHIRSLPVDGFVTSNGAYAVIDGEVVHQVKLEEERLTEVLDFFEENRIMYVAEAQDFAYYSDLESEELARYMALASMPVKYAKDAKIRDFKEINMFIAFTDTKEQEEKAMAFLTEFTFLQQTGYRCFDVLFTESSKSAGAMAVKAHFGDDYETYAFGDGENDMTLFQVVDTSIAMGNAHPDLKAIATHVTDDVEHDGIWKALKKLQLLDEDPETV
jgi:hypothetical protein